MPTLRDQLYDARCHLARAHQMGAERAVAVLEEQIEYLEVQLVALGQEVPGWD